MFISGKIRRFLKYSPLGIEGLLDAAMGITNPGSNFVVTAAQPFEEMGIATGQMIKQAVIDKPDPMKIFQCAHKLSLGVLGAPPRYA